MKKTRIQRGLYASLYKSGDESYLNYRNYVSALCNQ
jgi:hypothetical protein